MPAVYVCEPGCEKHWEKDTKTIPTGCKIMKTGIYKDGRTNAQKYVNSPRYMSDTTLFHTRCISGITFEKMKEIERKVLDHLICEYVKYKKEHFIVPDDEISGFVKRVKQLYEFYKPSRQHRQVRPVQGKPIGIRDKHGNFVWV